MKEEKFFKELPNPFIEREVFKLKERVLEALPRKNTFFYLKYAFIPLTILFFIFSFLLINKNKEDSLKIKERVFVQNPLKIKSEDIKIELAEFPLPEEKERVEDIPFIISKINDSIKLTWQEIPAKKYRIKKCNLIPPQKNCNYVVETKNNYFIDKDKEKENLVVYIVEAVKS